MADRDSGLVFDSENVTVEEYLNRWLTDSVRDTVRRSTYDSYKRMVDNHLVPGVGYVKLSKLKPDHLRQLYRQKLDSGLSTRSVQYMHTIAKKALKDAVRMERVPRNPADAVDPPKLVQDEIHPLSAAQVRALLAATEGERIQPLYTVAVHTGMRPGEMLALRWEDVDLDTAAARVNRALSDSGEMNEPKTAKSRRRIELSAAAVSALRAHRKRQLEERIEKAGLWEDYGLVFPSEVGTPMNRHNLSRTFKKHLRRAELPETFRLYDLRHTCATLLLSRNVHPKYVQELLGHAGITLTLDTYSHVIPGMDGGTASAMDEALG
ncbi:site-specific integrase [Rubrobacter aplysinae]|uniref:site-specific integrase n=1 Tax=Rubrobacter aplysinae TaxID=909625 RepID=UPI001F42EEFA|nr:site-specific integrase [Rubrobacter aplysinae]